MTLMVEQRTREMLREYLLSHTQFDTEVSAAVINQALFLGGKVDEPVPVSILGEKLSEIKVSDYGTGNIISILKHLKSLGYTDVEIFAASQALPALIDATIPRQVNYLYLKLDTGGFPGYNKGIQGYGERLFPILRVTAKINNEEVRDVIVNPEGGANVVFENTKRFHQQTGLWDKALRSKATIRQVDQKLADVLREAGVPTNNPGLNRHTHLVGYNTDFLKKFMEAQMPQTNKFFGLRDIDIYRLCEVNRINGSYHNVAAPQIWGSEDPIGYVNHLADIHTQLMESLRK